MASTVMNFVTSIIDVIFLGKRTPIPIPSLMRTVASSLTKTLVATFPKGIPYVNLKAESLSLALIATILPPLLWNLIGPFEYYTRTVSTIARKPIVGVYLSGTLIATLSVYRSALFTAAMRDQPVFQQLDTPFINALAGLLFVSGVIFFIGAYYQLGISGTYLGDYFGIFRDHRITAFPFNVMDNPMYDGSSIFHFAEGLLYVLYSMYVSFFGSPGLCFLTFSSPFLFHRNHKPAGIMMAVWLFMCYRIGCIFEEYVLMHLSYLIYSS